MFVFLECSSVLRSKKVNHVFCIFKVFVMQSCKCLEEYLNFLFDYIGNLKGISWKMTSIIIKLIVFVFYFGDLARANIEVSWCSQLKKASKKSCFCNVFLKYETTLIHFITSIIAENIFNSLNDLHARNSTPISDVNVCYLNLEF